MNIPPMARRLPGRVPLVWFSLAPILAVGAFLSARFLGGSEPQPKPVARPPITHEERKTVDSSGFSQVISLVKPWAPKASPVEIAESWRDIGRRANRAIDHELATRPPADESKKFWMMLNQAGLHHYEGETAQAARILAKARELLGTREDLAAKYLYTVIYLQGVTALRLGENENCIMCRGESSCILPISPTARHTKPEGSRRAIGHFAEYLDRFPDDLEVRWLLNLAHMTLGEYPDKVAPRYLVKIDHFLKSEFDIGKFRDVSDRAGVDRFNQSGGAIMEDFDGDGWLDLAVTSIDPVQPMSFYHNRGDGTFEDRSESAGVTDQLGGLYCVQADYDNDGLMDIFISRGAWIFQPMRPTLLRNEGGKFVDVTEKSGLLDPVNSISASWADYDNDGWLDLFVCCERQANRLYRNKKDGTFEEVAKAAGVSGDGRTICKGSAWLDFDNDGDLDLFLNHLDGFGRLYRNDWGNFADASASLGVDGPKYGFSCWAWDFDNDGWLDIFATSYDRTVSDVIRGMNGEPHHRSPNKLFRNLGGKGFADVTGEAGLDLVFTTMGSNFGDFDNDGFLDFYLGTGEPSLATLIPNRMFKNVAGRRFAEITASSGTGLLQKGHAVACGDWDRDGDVDIFAQTGGAVNGDKYHNVLFDNPGQGNHWLSVRLVGKKSNRAGIGARIKVVTAGEAPSTVRRHVSSGSSFGANTLRQHFGLAGANRVESLEVHWPTSGTTQVFRDIPADRLIEVEEFAEAYRTIEGGPTSKTAASKSR